MRKVLLRVTTGMAALIGVLALGGGSYAYMQCAAFDASLDKVYDVPIPSLVRSSDPAVVARGDHLLHSLAGCAVADCHGADLGGGRIVDIGRWVG